MMRADNGITREETVAPHLSQAMEEPRMPMEVNGDDFTAWRIGYYPAWGQTPGVAYTTGLAVLNHAMVKALTDRQRRSMDAYGVRIESTAPVDLTGASAEWLLVQTARALYVLSTDYALHLRQKRWARTASPEGAKRRTMGAMPVQLGFLTGCIMRQVNFV